VLYQHTHTWQERETIAHVQARAGQVAYFWAQHAIKMQKRQMAERPFRPFRLQVGFASFLPVSTRSIEPAAAARKTKDQNRCSAKLKRKCQSRIRIRIRPSVCVCVRVSVQRLRLGQVCQSASAAAAFSGCSNNCR